MIYQYDGTFEGLLTTIFESYRLQAPATDIVPDDEYQQSLFDTSIDVDTEAEQARRVIAGITKKCGKKGNQLIYHCFLSEQPGVEMLINHFVRSAMSSKHNILENYRDEKILKLHQIKKQVGREVHRMHAFVRFQETKDGMFVSLIEPDFNVLPLIGKHFVDRYPAQEWLIYDTKRRYGLYYDKAATRFITFSERQHRYLTEEVLTAAESQYQQLWKSYFQAVDIPERRNMKLHIQHVPRRYWKYLVEKWEF